MVPYSVGLRVGRMVIILQLFRVVTAGGSVPRIRIGLHARDFRARRGLSEVTLL